jgi:hypothetical protein
MRELNNKKMAVILTSPGMGPDFLISAGDEPYTKVNAISTLPWIE